MKAFGFIFSLIFLSGLLLNTPSYSENNIDSVWKALVFERSHCIGGQQYRFENWPARIPFFFNRPEWKNLLDLQKEKLGAYLLKQFNDTTTTNIHTCPFELATNGELAVYGLQQITKTNWYEIEEFKEYADKPISDNRNMQRWLWMILESTEKRAILEKEFQKLLSIETEK